MTLQGLLSRYCEILVVEKEVVTEKIDPTHWFRFTKIFVVIALPNFMYKSYNYILTFLEGVLEKEL